MKFFRLFSVFLLTLFISTLFGQTLRDEITANPDKAGGVYYVYTYDNPTYTPPPKGYKPFYLSHYGRHGSRRLLHDREYSDIMEIFDAAADANAFTELGRDVYERVKLIYEDGIDRAGDLTKLGVIQHHQIAERMFRNYPELFGKNSVIEAQSTTVVRCVLSMAAFCEQLKVLNPNLQISREAGRRTTRYLNFFNKPTNPTLSEKYLTFLEKGEWLEAYKEFENFYLRPERLMSLLFADSTFVESIDTQNLMRGLFYFAINMQDVTDIDVSLYDLFTTDELYYLNIYDNYRYYVMRGPSPLNHKFPQYYAKVLLEDFLIRADRALAGGGVSVDLRFGHDGNLMPFLALLQLDGCSPSIDESDPVKIAEIWSVYKISPMAANVQLVFYRKKGGEDILVKFLHNEREVQIPIFSEYAPYYRWSDVRAFYRKILEELSDPAAA